MTFINIEIKARTNRSAEIRKRLLARNAVCKGTDIQTDTYFNTPRGRLKLRQGNIENNLIYYERENTEGPRESHFNLVEAAEPEQLKQMLAAAMGIRIVVEKKREIFFIGNIKFHLDTLTGLGHFVEIEASNKYASLSVEELQEQCLFYMQEFGVNSSDLVTGSYSDMLLDLRKKAS